VGEKNFVAIDMNKAWICQWLHMSERIKFYPAGNPDYLEVKIQAQFCACIVPGLERPHKKRGLAVACRPPSIQTDRQGYKGHQRLERLSEILAIV